MLRNKPGIDVGELAAPARSNTDDLLLLRPVAGVDALAHKNLPRNNG